MINTTFFLVRHGRTAWNEEGRFQGMADIPLSPAGRADAEANAQRLADHLADVEGARSRVRLVSSPLARCMETARILGRRLAMPERSIESDDRLAEAGFGHWEGMTTHEVKARFPEERRARKADRWNFAPEGGGSYADLDARMKFFTHSLASDALPIIVTHSGNLRVMIGVLEGLGRDETMRRAIPHDRVFRWSNGRLDEI
ncbi:histidine phosphatase family protein [Aquibium sp. ELW1220]|uniref:histidine phosphatase family protein n=1 Tax=Aquibium sp. ELW1220 TaxID=2976766 RepID=UPI0025B0A680|nr:histidine phosphatase family protein [Aquibium sp. ELW1220]MDN2580810.1 histidine phosphatase family protein [Aquibium sp. ELW1220]